MNPERMTSIPDLSVVMPCYNESGGIEEVLTEWSATLSEHIDNFEIIVVNDGSKDGTGRILDRLRRDMKSLRVIHQLNAGHGGAVRRGYDAARGRYILQVNASGRYEPSDFLPLWEKRSYHPLVLGVRTHRMDGWMDRLCSKLLARVATWGYGSRLQDLNVPFRLFRREIARPYLESISKGSLAVNALLAALWFRDFPDQVCEVPVPHRARPNRHQVRDGRCSITHRVSMGWHFAEQFWRYRSTYAGGQSPRPLPS